MKLTANSFEANHRVLVSGLSGTGKSTLLAKLAESFDLIWLDLENGKDVLTKLSPAALERIEYISIPDSASYPIAAQTLMSLFKSNKANICELHGKDNCALCRKDNLPTVQLDFTHLPSSTIVVIDGITQLAASILAYTCKDKPVDYKPERDDWGALRKYSEFFASQFQAFQGNLACTCHAVEAEMEDGRTKLVPSFGSKDMSTKIAKAFSDVVYCDVKNRKHIAFSASTASSTVLTKSRSDFLVENCDVPSLVGLFSSNKVVAPTGIAEQLLGKEVLVTIAVNKPAPDEVVKLDLSGVPAAQVTPAAQAASNLSARLAAIRASKVAPQ